MLFVFFFLLGISLYKSGFMRLLVRFLLNENKIQMDFVISSDIQCECGSMCPCSEHDHTVEGS